MIVPGFDKIVVELDRQSEREKSRRERRNARPIKVSSRGKSETQVVSPGAEGPKHYTGEVVSVGRGSLSDSGRRKEAPCAVGDTVGFNQYSGDEVEYDGKKFVVLDFYDVKFTIEDDAEED